MASMDKFLKKYAISDSAAEGLTNAQAEAYQREHGYNEIIAPEVSKFWIFVGMFRGTMPYMLEVALVVAAIVEDWPDVAIIGLMLIANGLLGFKEEMECLEALAKLTETMESKVTCVRDGIGASIPTRLLVPGDIIMLLNGLFVSTSHLLLNCMRLGFFFTFMTPFGFLPYLTSTIFLIFFLS